MIAKKGSVGHAAQVLDSALSRMQLKVAAMVCGGSNTLAIAKQLRLSPYTIRNHLKAIYAKLGVRSQAALVLRLSADRQQTLHLEAEIATLRQRVTDLESRILDWERWAAGRPRSSSTPRGGRRRSTATATHQGTEG